MNRKRSLVHSRSRLICFSEKFSWIFSSALWMLSLVYTVNLRIDFLARNSQWGKCLGVRSRAIIFYVRVVVCETVRRRRAHCTTKSIKHLPTWDGLKQKFVRTAYFERIDLARNYSPWELCGSYTFRLWRSVSFSFIRMSLKSLNGFRPMMNEIDSNEYLSSLIHFEYCLLRVVASYHRLILLCKRVNHYLVRQS